MKMKKILIFLLFTAFGFSQNPISAPSPKQNIGVNYDFKNFGIYNSTLFNVNFRPLTTAQINAITTPKVGQIVYNTTTNTNWFYNGSTWGEMGGSGTPFNLNSTGTEAGSNKVDGINRDGSITVNNNFIRANSSSTLNSFTLDPTDIAGPKLKLGTAISPELFFAIGAYNSQNNFDTKARDLQFFGTGSGNTTGLMLKANTGNVGIRTIAPLTDLHIQSSLNATNTINANATMFRLQRAETTNSKWGNIAQFNLGSYNGSTVSATTRLDLQMTDGVSNTMSNVMTWQANGNIGIGTTAPTEKLHVVGNIRFTGALMPNNSAGTAGQILVSSGSGNPPTWTTIAGATPYTAGDGIAIDGSNVVSINSWVFFVNQWSVVPIIIATITGVPAGDVWQYTYKGVTRYRFVPTTYDPTLDAFYSSWNASTSTLSGLIVTRG